MENRIREYAKLAVVAGVHVQKGQTLIVNASIDCAMMTRFVVEEAYKAGANKVIVNYRDDYIQKMKYEYESEETLCTIPDYIVEQKVTPLKEGAATITLMSEIPQILKGVDAQKIAKANIAMRSRCYEMDELTMSNKVQWCIIGVPNQEWATKVFPDLSKEEALAHLWEAILSSVHVREGVDPVKKWEEHDAQLGKMVDKLNAFNFDALHFTNHAGTNLHVQLIDQHIWAGGSDETDQGIIFNANMPTEEVFTMPYKYGVNGRVVSTKPLHYNGVIIPAFTLTFKDGKVIDYDAQEGKETLQSLIEYDEGSAYLGEVALVPYNSPISKSNILYFNTLYDENASCHLALGRAYPMNVKDGVTMKQEQLDAIGCNHSMAHVDFMFGSEDMQIVGITKEGHEVVVFKDGDFYI